MYQGLVPTVDSSFEKDLKEFARSQGSQLWVEFDRTSERFVIKQKSRLYGDAIALVVETDEGEFRQPNLTDIALLYWGDLWRRGDPKAQEIFGENEALEKMERDDKKAEEELRDATKDDKYTLRRELLKAMGEVADAPHVRRVEPKSKGFTIKDLRKFKRDD